MRTLIVVVCLTSLAGCLTNNDVRMTTEHAQFIDKVGVISLLDQHANVHYAAQEPKDIIDRKALIQGWRINTLVGEHLVGRLNQKGYNARIINVAAEELPAYDNSWARANTLGLHPKLYEIGKAAGVDMLVVVYRERVAEFISKSRDRLRGYGVFKSHRVEPHLYAAVYVEALNVEKQYVLGKASGQQAIKLEGNDWRNGFEPGKSPILLPFKGSDPQAEELTELVKLAALLAAQEAGLSN